MADQTPVPDVSVVLVCWNNAADLSRCLASLFGAGLRHTLDVVVVDNGSVDGSQQMLAQQYPQVRLIQNDTNVGLAAASNQGIRATAGRFVLLLNNDTIVNAPSIDILVEVLEAHPGAGAAAGRLLNADGSFQSGYARFSTLAEELLVATGLGEWLWPGYPVHRDATALTPVGWMCSACLLLRRDALDDVGLLDDTYFIYGDEVDLQYRLAKAGRIAYFVPESTTIHLGGRSLDRWKRRRMVYRAKILFYLKNYGATKASILRAMLAAVSAAKLLVWSPVLLLPSRREAVRKELRSNWDVIALCLAVK